MSNLSLLSEIDILDNTAAKRDYPYVWETFKAAFPRVTDDEIAKMVSISVRICGECHEDTRPCYCSRDD
jgi:hypothetical protein